MMSLHVILSPNSHCLCSNDVCFFPYPQQSLHFISVSHNANTEDGIFIITTTFCVISVFDRTIYGIGESFDDTNLFRKSDHAQIMNTSNDLLSQYNQYHDKLKHVLPMINNAFRSTVVSVTETLPVTKSNGRFLALN
eukprot:976610_1